MSDIQVGDIVTAYQKGYWRVEEIVPRYCDARYFKYSSYEEIEPGVYRSKYAPYDVKRIGEPYSPLVTLVKVVDTKFKPSNAVRSQCDISYCVPIDDAEINDLIAAYTSNLEALRQLLPEHRRNKEDK